MVELNLNKINFDELIKIPLKDLLAFQDLLSKAIEERRDSEKTELLEKLNTLASESGYSLNDLIGSKPKKKVQMKYRHPDDSSLTWVGKGRKPNWVISLLESGKTLKELEI